MDMSYVSDREIAQFFTVFHIEYLSNRKSRLTPAPLCLVERHPCGQGTMYFHMTDSSVGLQQEAWLHCFAISPETRTEYPCYGVLCMFCVRDASLPVVGTATTQREGDTPA